MHAGLITLWAGAMSLFEAAHYVSEKSIHEQGFILPPHMATLSFGVGPGGEIYSTYPFFIIGVLHIIVSGILGLGGIYHFIFGPKRLEETSLGTPFAFSWQDRDKVSTVLGAHLIILSLGSILLYIKGVYFGGLYDPLSSGGGDIRVVKETLVSLNPYSVAKYLVHAPFRNEGWIVSINNLEDLLGGHLWVGAILPCWWHLSC